MNVKHSVMIALMGRQTDKYQEYSPARGLGERMKMCQQIKGAQGIEIVYPSDFENPEATIALVRESGFKVSAVNLNVKSARKWKGGSFTANDPAIRADAVADMKTCMDLAATLGSNLVTCCPLADGHDYNFQIEYREHWQYLLEGLREAAGHRRDVKISLEYKQNETRNYIILPDVGTTLYLCERIGLPNIGVTMDTGHAFLAQESPAQSACLAMDAGRLFYVHFNDNTRNQDWDMLPASVNLWDFLETLYYLDKYDCDVWFSYDVKTRWGELVDDIQSTVNIIDSLMALLDKLGRDKLQSLIEKGVPSATFDFLLKSLVR